MSSRPLQPSEYEIQREVEALRDIRRRSTTPGALAIDPDLPNQSPPASPTANYWGPKPSNSALNPQDLKLSVHLKDPPSSVDHGLTQDLGRTADPPNNPADDPFHLFWVPASLHPEIAPAEFRAFLKEHSRSPSLDSQDPQSVEALPSLSPSTSLSRKKSMLSRQYRPKENDDVEEENIVPLKRNRSLLYPTNPGPQLTISDLQKLEELAEEAQESDDPSRLRNVLRRSLSLNLSPTAIDLMGEEMPEMGDEADAPIIIPPRGQILRRAARTKIRKPGLPGDGNGHRFGSRRAGTRSNTAPAEPRTSSDISSNDHSESDHSSVALRRPTFSDDKANLERPDSYSEETSIYDAYARSEDEDAAYVPIATSETALSGASPIVPTDEPPQIPADILPDSPDILGPSLHAEPQLVHRDHTQQPILPPSQSQPIPHQIQQPPVIHQPAPQPPSSHQSQPVVHQPQPQRLLVPQPTDNTPSRTPSPAESTTSDQQHNAHSLPGYLAATPVTGGRKDKDKKGLFGKWGGDKGGKKSKESRGANSAEKEKEQSGFFGSLFGKKKQDSEYQSSMTGGTSGREAAQALLGASKSSKSYVPSTSPGLAPGIGGNPYARYPIHVERAIYRLSHIKLANPRRPLYEQVLISNLMFWYLGVINKTQNPSPTSTPANGSQPAGGASDESEAEKEQKEKEQKEKEQKEKAEKERLERERQEKEQRERERERELEMKKKDTGKRGSLTKPMPGNRRAEMPIKGPQYEMQHRVMEQEYGPYSGPPPRSPTSSSTQMNGAPPQQYGRSPPQAQYGSGPPKMQSPPKGQPEHYYQSQPENNKHRAGLPPGAMAPVDQSAWIGQPGSPTGQRRGPNQGPPPLAGPPNPGPPNRNSRSPPPQIPQIPSSQPMQPMQLPRLNTSQDSLGERNGSRSPARSLSATAASPAAFSNGQLRKGNSAHVAAPYNERRPRTSEGVADEEDVPLSVWQQQRRK